MTTTISIDRVGGTPADVSISKLSEASFAAQGTEVVPGGYKTIYTIASGDQAHPTTLVVQSKLDPKGNGGKGTRSALFALNSWARVDVDGTVESIEPVSSVLSINVPMNTQLEVADLRDMLENLYSATYATLDTKEPENFAWHPFASSA